MLCGGHLLDLEQPASAFCYNYPPLKGNVCVSTATLSGEFRVVLHECNTEHTAASAQLNHLELLSLDQLNCSYSAQLSVS